MEFNLKNRPRICKVTIKDKRLSEKPVTVPKIPYPETYEEWFEGFEKKMKKRHGYFVKIGRLTIADFIEKEVLGE